MILTSACSVSVLLYVLLLSAQERRTFAQSLQSDEAGAQETYVSEVIIEAPWAEKNLYQYAGGEESPPGEFGHYVSEETESGPNSFTVAPNGDVYINDPLNKRIQRFGPDGQFISVIPVNAGFMCVDKHNYIYSTRPGRPCWFIDKYDQAGNLHASYPIEVGKKRISAIETENKILQNIYCDNSGGVFAGVRSSRTKVDEVSGTFLDSAWGGICQVGNAAGVFSAEEQNRTMKKQGFLGINSALLGKGYLSADRGSLYLIDLAGDTVQMLQSMQGSFLGCDEDLNFYTTETPFDFHAHEYDEQAHSPVVRKYNLKGQLVATFRYWCGKPYTGIFIGFGFSSSIGDCVFLDNRGNFYVFCQSYEDGIKVIKWYKAD